MTKYKMIAQQIKDKIKNNEYDLDTPLPNQETLAKEFNVSRMTIQKALRSLIVEGVIFSRQGSGSYIRKNTLQQPSFDLSFDKHTGLTQRVGDKAKITNKILSFSVRFPTPIECEKLLISSTDPIYDIVRLRFLDDKPYLIEYTKTSVNVIPNLTEEILMTSVYSYINDILKLKIGGANRRIKADKPNELEIKYLECDKNDPMLEVEQVTYLANGTPFEYLKSRHRYDKRAVLVHSLYNDN